METVVRHTLLLTGVALMMIGFPMRTSNDSGALMGNLFIAVGVILILGWIALAFF